VPRHVHPPPHHLIITHHILIIIIRAWAIASAVVAMLVRQGAKAAVRWQGSRSTVQRRYLRCVLDIALLQAFAAFHSILRNVTASASFNVIARNERRL
jgi:hypothetical protein